MATTQTYSGLSAEQKTFYNRTLLSRLLPTLVFAKYGQKKSAPKREGDTMNFRKFNSLAAATTPLTEGVTPAGKSLSITAVTATVEQYGDYVEISDKLDMVGIDPVLTETGELLGEQAGLTVDTIVRDEVCAGTNVQYANAKGSRAAVAKTDVLNSTEIRKAVRTLRKANAKPIDGKSFVGIVGADGEFDLMSDPYWQDVSKYAASTQIFDGELGKLGGVRFVRASNTPVFAGSGNASADVHATMIIGKDAYGIVDIEGSSKPEMIVKPHGSAGSADPLNQRATSGWKALFTAKRLEELAMVRIEHGVTA